MNYKKILLYICLGIIILGIVVVLFVRSFYSTDNDPMGSQSKTFFDCIAGVHMGYEKFWQDYEKNKPDISQIVDFDNSYEQDKENCYIKYHSFFILFGGKMTNVEIFNKVKELEQYIQPENVRLFESASVDSQIQLAPQVFPINQ